MKFNEAFEHYKQGTASAEETAFVEGEIEKYEAIGDWLYQKVDDTLSENLGQAAAKAEMGSEASFTRAMRKSIRGAFIKAGAVLLAACLALILFFQFGASPLLNALYYNPAKRIDDHYSQFTLDMRVYSELCQPVGTRWGSSATPRGYGVYDIALGKNEMDQLETLPRVTGQIVRGRLTLYDPALMKDAREQFWLPGDTDYTTGTPQDNQRRIVGLREDSLYRVTVSFNKYLSPGEMYQLENRVYWGTEDQGLRNGWWAARTSEDGHADGACYGLQKESASVIFSDELYNAMDGYPDLIWGVQPSAPVGTPPANYYPVHTDEELRQHLLSMLQYMKDNAAFCRVMDEDPSTITQAANYVEQHDLSLYGAVYFLNKTQIERLLDSALTAHMEWSEVEQPGGRYLMAIPAG